MKRIVVLFSGEGTNLLNLIETLPVHGVEVAAAVTNRPDAAGIEKARERGVAVEVVDHTCYPTREAFDAVLAETVERYAPDLTVTAGFMRILTPVFTERVRAVNVHPSLLPKFKGANAIARAFESGDASCGVSVHWVTHELDGGEVIAQAVFEREPGMTSEAFEARIHALEYALLPEAVVTVLGAS